MKALVADLNFWRPFDDGGTLRRSVGRAFHNWITEFGNALRSTSGDLIGTEEVS